MMLPVSRNPTVFPAAPQRLGQSIGVNLENPWEIPMVGSLKSGENPWGNGKMEVLFLVLWENHIFPGNIWGYPLEICYIAY